MFRFAHFLSYCGFGFHGKSIGSYLVDDYYKRPVIISEYPEQLKPFYAHLMEDETKVSAFDIVMPKVSKKVLRTKGKKKRLYSSSLASKFSHQVITIVLLSFQVALPETTSSPCARGTQRRPVGTQRRLWWPTAKRRRHGTAKTVFAMC